MLTAILLAQLALGLHVNYLSSSALRWFLQVLLLAGAVVSVVNIGVPFTFGAGMVAAIFAVTILARYKDPLVSLPVQVGLITGARFIDQIWTSSSVFAVFVLVAALVALLGKPANDVCRSVLVRMPDKDVVGDTESTLVHQNSDYWTLFLAKRPVASLHKGKDVEHSPRLKGGRFIGPLERWLILLLGVISAYPVIAALMAAKGIGRFPELAADRAKGAKAEEFLVGSLTSWGLAGLAALLLSSFV